MKMIKNKIFFSSIQKQHTIKDMCRYILNNNKRINNNNWINNNKQRIIS